MTDYELFYLWESNHPIKDQLGELVKYHGRLLQLGEIITILGIEYVVIDTLGDIHGLIAYIVERKEVAA